MYIETSRGLKNVLDILPFSYLDHCRSSYLSDNVVTKMINGENRLENKLQVKLKAYVVVNLPELDDETRTRREIFNSYFKKVSEDPRIGKHLRDFTFIFSKYVCNLPEMV